MRFSTINTLVEGLTKEVASEKKNRKVLTTKEKALRKALTESKQAIDRNNHRGGRKIADYRRSFEELLESYYPGKPWYKITTINIDDEFANGCTPEQVITKIVENINSPKQKKSQKLNESVKLTEGSRSQKARAVLNKLKGNMGGDDDMYEELNYDDFGDEPAWEQDERISFSDLDNIDESCVKEGARANKAKAALKNLLHEEADSYTFKSEQEAKRYWIDNFWNSKYGIEEFPSFQDFMKVCTITESLCEEADSYTFKSEKEAKQYWIDNFWNSKYGIEEYPSFQDFMKVCTITESLCEDDDIDIDINDEGEVEDVAVDGEEIEDIPEPTEDDIEAEDGDVEAEEEPVEENPIAEKIEEIKELIQEIEDEFDDEIWDDEIEDMPEPAEEPEDIPEPEIEDEPEEADDEPEEIEEIEDEPIDEGVRADKVRAVLKGFKRG